MGGKVFTRLTVIKRDGAVSEKDPHVAWLCRCTCGTECRVASNRLLLGRTTSCGCARAKHGYARLGKKHPIYGTWLTLRDRCNNPRNKGYQYYGGRGIKVCPEWDNFEVFLADMGERPKGLSIDRKDNNGGYCRENCRWATREEQNNNTRVVRWLSYKGKTQSLSAWGRHFGVSAGALHGLLKKHSTLEGVAEYLRHRSTGRQYIGE